MHARKALKQGWVRPNKRIFNNAKVTDHFAIIPTGTVPKHLDETEQKIYDFVAQALPRGVLSRRRSSRSRRASRAWRASRSRPKARSSSIPAGSRSTARRPRAKATATRPSCRSQPGETAQTEAVEVKENVTKPPPRYNEATLLSAMEGAGKLVDDEELREAMREKGLGTPATRAQIIEGLIYEGYIIRDGRELVVTAKGSR